MKNCPVCNINLPDDEIYCPTCGELLLVCGQPSERRRVVPAISGSLPTAMTMKDIMLGKQYGKRTVKALRVLAIIASVLLGLAMIVCGVLIMTGLQDFGLTKDQGMLVGIAALPTGIILGLLVYFILNISLIKYENISLIGRNTEAQLCLLENQSALLSTIMTTVAETNRRINGIDDRLDELISAGQELAGQNDSLMKQLRQMEQRTETAADQREDTYISAASQLSEGMKVIFTNQKSFFTRMESCVASGLVRILSLLEGKSVKQSVELGERVAMAAEQCGKNDDEIPDIEMPVHNNHYEPEEQSADEQYDAAVSSDGQADSDSDEETELYSDETALYDGEEHTIQFSIDDSEAPTEQTGSIFDTIGSRSADGGSEDDDSCADEGSDGDNNGDPSDDQPLGDGVYELYQ